MPKAKKTAKKNIKILESGKTRSGATAMHGKHEDDHIVGIGNLRVIVCEDEGIWFAQGLEIDYAANGKTLKEAKKNFEHGLAATIELHLQAFESIEKLLVPAPASAWKTLPQVKRHMKYSQVSIHQLETDSPGKFEQLPYSGISYLVEGNEVAA